MIKNLLTTLLKIAVSGVILYFLFRGMDIGLFWQTVRSVNPRSVVFVADT